MSAYGCNPLSSPQAQAVAAQAANTAYMAQQFVPASDQAYGEIASRVLQWITDGLQAQVDAQAALAAKIAAPLASGLSQQEAAMARIGGAVTSSIQGGLAALGPVQPAGTTGQITGPNYEQGWNLWSVRTDTGWGKPIAEQWFTSYKDGCQYLFRGWALELADAQALAASLPELGRDVRPECFPAIVNPIQPSTPCPPGVKWAVWVFPTGTIGICSYPYCDGLQPDPTGLGGHKELFDDYASAVAFAASSTCTGITPPTVGPTMYYGGCLSNQAITWSSTDKVPTGVTNVVGPFPDQASALAAAGSCLPIITPPTVGTGQCCGIDPKTGALILPSCIMIDLCRWDEFCREMSLAVRQALNSTLCDPTCFVQPLCDCLKKTLCEVFSDKQCTSGYQDAERYIFEDQDKQFFPAIEDWLGQTGQAATNQTVDDMIATASGLASRLAADVVDTGPDWFGPR
jgi:hypothetical protein